MADYTKNYNLKKPNIKEKYSVNDQNENMDILDGELRRINVGIGELEKEVNTGLADLTGEIATIDSQLTEKAKKATNEDTATAGQIKTANGDGTFSFMDNSINIVDRNNREFIPTMEIQNLLELADSSPSQNGTPIAFTSNPSYIFMGGNSRELWKIDKNTLQKIGNTADLGADIRGIIADEKFVYVACQNLNFKKLDVNTLVQVAEYSKKVETGLFCACQDETFLYVKSDQRTIEKIDKSTMVCKADFVDYDSNISIYDIAIKNNDIYTVGKYSSVGRLRKLSKIDMSNIYFSNTNIDLIKNICISDDGLFSFENHVTTTTPPLSTIYKRDLLGKSLVKSISVANGEIVDMFFRDGYLYTIQSYIEDTPDKSLIKKYDSNLKLIASSKQERGSFSKIEVDGSHIFSLTGNKTQRVLKEPFVYYDGETDKNNILASNIVVDYKIKYLRRV